MITIGKFLFKYRNGIAPLLFLFIALDMVPIVRPPPCRPALIVAGLLIAGMGQTLRAVAIGLRYIKRGGKNKEVYADTLVTAGAFAHSRNPLYLGNILMVTGAAVAANALLFLLIGVPLVIFAFLCIVAAEEQFLRAKFGEEFEQYCRKVNRFLPRLAGIGETFRSRTFHWRRVIAKDYQTMYAWTAGITLMVWEDDWLALRAMRLWPFAVILAGLTLAFVASWTLKKCHLLDAVA